MSIDTAAFDEFAAREPYFAVFTAPEFLRANLTPEREREFFASGEKFVDRMFGVIEAGLVPHFAPISMLEYGCGPGRLAIPLARRPGSVTAIDSSPAMLDLAKHEARRRGAGHIVFQNPDALLTSPQRFDLVVCYHVLQRLPRPVGLALLARLIDRIAPNGVGVFQWPLGTGTSTAVGATRWAREHVPGVNTAINRVRGKPAADPFIPTHAYTLDDVLPLLRAAGCHRIHVIFEPAHRIEYAITVAHKSDPVAGGHQTVALSNHTDRFRPSERSAAPSGSAAATNIDIDEFNRTAEAYYATLANWDHHLAKPFSQISETPAILGNLAVMLKSLDLSPGLHVLDFGAGTGWLARLLTQLGCRVTLLDVSPTALAIAREHYLRQPIIGDRGDRPPPSFLVFDGRRIDLADASVDRIVCFDAFHHAANPDAMIAEFGRILVPGGLAGFAEPGPRHSQSARSSFEANTYGVVERDVDVHAIWRAAQACGFSDLRMCVFPEPGYEVSLAEYEDLSTGGPTGTQWLETTRRFLHLVRNFVLVKAGQVRADSRSARGLACEIRTAQSRVTAAPGMPATIDVTVTNTGRAYWLASDVPHGGVSLGAHVYDEHGALVDFEGARAALTNPPRDVAPNEAVMCRVTVPQLAPGRYKVELDCVADQVTWFAQAGSPPATVGVDVEG